jgi:hypothetical protein
VDGAAADRRLTPERAARNYNLVHNIGYTRSLEEGADEADVAPYRFQITDDAKA